MTKTTVQYVVQSAFVSGVISKHRRLNAAAKSAYKHRSQHARVYAVVDCGLAPVPVCWDVTGTWALGEWDDHTPSDLIAAVESER